MAGSRPMRGRSGSRCGTYRTWRTLGSRSGVMVAATRALSAASRARDALPPPPARRGHRARARGRRRGDRAAHPAAARAGDAGAPPGRRRPPLRGGLVGHWSVALLEDVLGDDVLLAERLDGRPLDADHGACCAWSARASTGSSTPSTCAASSLLTWAFGCSATNASSVRVSGSRSAIGSSRPGWSGRSPGC